MSDDLTSRAVFEVVGDSTQFTAAVASAETAASKFERTAVNSFGKAAEALAGTGKSAAGSADQLDAAGRRFIASLERQHAQLTLSREDYLRLQAAAKGVPETVYEPLIRKLVAAEAAAKALGAVTPGAANGLNQVGASAAQTTAAMRQLPAQITDIVTSLSSGQSAFTVLIQQGGQIKDSFGGIGNAMRALAGAVTPMGLAITGAAAAVFGLGAAYLSGARDSVEFRQAMLAGGNAAGLTEGKFNALAESVAAATRTTIGSTRDVVQQLAASGRFSEEALGSAARAVQTVSKATGQEATDLLRSFIGLSDGVAKGVEALNRQYHFLTAAQLEAIKRAEEQGDTQRALSTAFDALSARIEAQSTATKGLSGWWDEAKRAVSGYIDAAKSIGRDSTIDDELKKQENYLRTLQAARKSGVGGTANGLNYRDALAVDSGSATLDSLVAGQTRLVERLKESKALGDGIANNTARAAQAEQDKAAAGKMVEATMGAQARLAKDMADAAAKLSRGGITGDDAAKVINDIVQRSQAMQQAWATSAAQAGASFQAVTTRIAGEVESIQSKLRQGLIDPISAVNAVAAKDIERLQAERKELEANLAIARQKRDNDAQIVQIQGQIAAKAQEIVNRSQAARNAVDEQIAGIKRGAEKMLADDAADSARLRAEQQDREIRNYVSLRDSIEDYSRSLADSVSVSQAEVAMLGKSDAERAITLATLRAEIALRNQLRQIEKQPDLLPADRARLKGQAQDAYAAAVQGAGKLGSDTALKSLYDFLDPARAQTFGEALTDAFGRAGDALSKLTSSLQAYGRNEAQIAKQRQNLEFVEDPGKRMAAATALHRKEQEASVALYADMAGAAKGFFDQGSRGYKALEAAETAFRAYQLASNAAAALASITQSQAVGAASVGPAIAKEGSISGIYGAVAMAALMAAVGFSTGFLGSRGGAPDVAARQAATGTGTVLGDSAAKSESISNALDILADTARIELPIQSAMLRALESIDNSMAGLANLMARSAGLTTGKDLGIFEGTVAVNKGDPILNGLGKNEIFGIDASKALNIFGSLGFVKTLQGLWGKTTQNVSDTGLNINATVDQLIKGIGVQRFADVSTTTSSWFGLKKNTTTSTQFAPVEEAIAKQFGLIFQNIGNTIKTAADSLGVGDAGLSDAVGGFLVEVTKLSLKDLKGQELQDAISSAIGAQADTLAAALLPGLGDFQEVGEGYFETLVRVAGGVETAQQALSAFGITAVGFSDIVQKQGDVAAEIVRQSITAVESAGGALNNVGQIVSLISGSAEDIADAYGSLLGLQDAMRLVGLSGESLSVALLRGAGGIDALQTSLQSYYDNFFTAQERASAAAAALVREFNALGVDVVPQTRQQFRDLIVSLEEAGPASAELLAKVLGMADAFGSVADQFDAIAAKRSSLDAQLLRAQGDELAAVSLERELELNALEALSPALVSLQQAIWDTIDATEAAKTAAAQAKAEADILAARPNNRFTSQSQLDTAASAILEGIDFGELMSRVDITKAPQRWLDHLASNDPGWDEAFVRQSLAINQRVSEMVLARSAFVSEDQSRAMAQLSQSGGVSTDDTTQQQLNATRELISSLDSLEASLQEYTQSLLIGDLSALDPEQQYAQARAAVDNAIAQSRAGDLAAMQAAQGAIDAYLRVSKGFNASGDQYAADFKRMVVVLDELKALQRQLLGVTAAGSSATEAAVRDGNAITAQSLAYQLIEKSRNVE